MITTDAIIAQFSSNVSMRLNSETAAALAPRIYILVKSKKSSRKNIFKTDVRCQPQAQVPAAFFMCAASFC